jgi:MFS transporter, SP family, sugar:H+ symporter
MAQSLSSPNNGSLWYVFLLSSTAALGGFLFGYDSGVINGTVTALQKSFASSDFGTGFSVASMLLGCAFGAYLVGPLADRLGRKNSMLLTALLFILSAWGSGVSGGVPEFIIYRLLGGLAVGAASVLAPAYISEISPEAYRGRFASLQQLAIVLGIFFAFLSNYLIAEIAGGAEGILWMNFAAWRWMYWMEIIPATLFFLLALLIPESPRYLVARKNESQALIVLERSVGVRAESILVEIRQTLVNYTPPRLRDIWDKHSSRIYPLLWVGMGLSVFQQFVGINVVFYYGAVLWQAAGFSEADALRVNVISGTVNVVSTFVAIALVDKIGRKPLLLVGGVGMFLSLSGLAWIFSSAGLDASGKLILSEDMGFLALLLANVYVFSFGCSWGPCVWVLLGEIFNNRMRAMALALSASIQWFANFAITLSFPVMLSRLGLGVAYGFYALCALAAIVFVLSKVPETRGRKLEEMA